MKNVTHNLMEESPGLFLNPPHAKLIFNYAKKTIILPKLFRNTIAQVYYVIQENECYGAILIKSAKPISLKEFSDTMGNHRITEKEREGWWKNRKVLFAYYFDVVQKFDKPKLIKDSKNRALGDNIEFLSEDKPLNKIELSERIKPTKELIKVFSNIQEAVEHIGDNKFAVEKKFDGSRVLIYKNGEEVKFYSEDDENISKEFESFKEESKNLSDENFIVDGKIVVKGNKSKIYLFDILRLGEDIRSLPWNERKSKLHSLNFTDSISEVPSIIVSNKLEGEKAIKFLEGLPGSLGVMIKAYNSKYLKDWCQLEE